jgi:signal transduction histidine kinase
VVGTRWQAVDAVAAGLVLVICGYAAQEAHRVDGWQWALVVAVALPVAWRNRSPLPTASVTVVAAGALLAGGLIPPYAAPVLCAAVALTQYPAAATRPPARSVAVLIIGMAGAGTLAIRSPGAPLVAVPAVGVPWLVGWLVRHRRAVAGRVAERRTGEAVTEERLRIARDMHDSVAHSLSMIAMKASVARHVAAVRPQESLAALEVIESASRAALTEMRRAVGLLRADPGDDGGPTGSAEDLRTLARRAGEAGVVVELTVAGTDVAPAGVRLAVYRIVQEALTNVVRHAHASRCEVLVATGPDEVTVSVLDNGRAVPLAGPGHGLRGMRERVEAYGGSLSAGSAPGGGFAVSAWVPVRP